MSDPNPPSKRPRRRRRSNRDRPKADNAANATPEASADTPPSNTGYSNHNASTADPKPDNRPPKKPRQNQNRKPAKPATRDANSNTTATNQADNKAQGKPKPKRKKPRTKTCFNCYTPCLSLFRVQVDHTARWKFVCDICWDSVALDNPHYKFGGVWPPPRQARGGKPKGNGPPRGNGQPKAHTKSSDSNPQ
ncbi:MAG: hypothetical protein AAF710_00110 [Planctomycetota bacterium]